MARDVDIGKPNLVDDKEILDAIENLTGEDAANIVADKLDWQGKKLSGILLAIENLTGEDAANIYDDVVGEVEDS